MSPRASKDNGESQVNRSFKHKWLGWSGGILSLGLSVSPAWADRINDYIHERTYLGILGTSVSVASDGVFNGKNYSRYDNPYELVLLPTLAQNFGFGALIGHREETYAIELSYWQSQHLATFGPATVDVPGGTVVFPKHEDKAAYHAVNLDFKKYFLTELPYQPFLNLGVSFPWVDLDHAAANSAGEVATATVAGLGLNLGIGLEYYLTPNISVLGGAYEKWTSFDQFKGHAAQYGPLSPNGGGSHDGSGLHFAIGTTVGFQ